MSSLEREFQIRMEMMDKYSQVLELLSKHEEASSIKVEIRGRSIRIWDRNNLRRNRTIPMRASDELSEELIQQLIRRINAGRAAEARGSERPLI